MAHVELVLPALEARHDVLAPTLAGHAGGPQIAGETAASAIVEAVERAMDKAGFASAHVVGNSLGGYIALQLAMRGRARSVVAFAPAGGWAAHDHSFRDSHVAVLLAHAAPAEARRAARGGGARHARGAAPREPDDRDELRAHSRRAARASAARRRRLLGADTLTERAVRDGWRVDPERIECPVRIVWGTQDKLLPWPSAAARFRREWLAHADWIELDGVGHCPQLDVPAEAAQLILGFTS